MSEERPFEAMDPIERAGRLLEGAMALATGSLAAASFDAERLKAYERGCALAEAALRGAVELAGASPNAQAEATRELAAVAGLLADRMLSEPQAAPTAEAA